jgi:hypothetical protein
MQKPTLALLLSLTLVLSVANAEARTTKRTTTNNNTTTSEQIETHQAASSHSGGTTFDMGVSSISAIPVPNGTGGSLTGIIHLTNLDMIQLLAGVTGTTGGFGFGVGGLYKRTVMGNQSAGFDLGGGFGIGTVAGAGGAAAVGSSTSFAFSITAVIGAHFEIPGTPIALHFNGGPAFSLVSISGTNGIGGATVTNFAMGPLSSFLGSSIVYTF